MKNTYTLTQAVALRTEELLKKNKLSKYKLGKVTCLDKTTLQSIFKHKTKDIRLSTVLLIANFFNMNLSEFLNIKEFDFENIEI